MLFHFFARRILLPLLNRYLNHTRRLCLLSRSQGRVFDLSDVSSVGLRISDDGLCLLVFADTSIPDLEKELSYYEEHASLMDKYAARDGFLRDMSVPSRERFCLERTRTNQVRDSLRAQLARLRNVAPPESDHDSSS